MSEIRKLAGRVIAIVRTRDDGKRLDRWQFLVDLDDGETVEIDAVVFDSNMMDAEFYKYTKEPIPIELVP